MEWFLHIPFVCVCHDQIRLSLGCNLVLNLSLFLFSALLSSSGGKHTARLLEQQLDKWIRLVPPWYPTALICTVRALRHCISHSFPDPNSPCLSLFLLFQAGVLQPCYLLTPTSTTLVFLLLSLLFHRQTYGVEIGCKVCNFKQLIYSSTAFLFKCCL